MSITMSFFLFSFINTLFLCLFLLFSLLNSDFTIFIFGTLLSIGKPKLGSFTIGQHGKTRFTAEFLTATNTLFWQLLIWTQIAIINLKTWCLKWQISINILKTNYIFYDRKKLPPQLSILVTSDKNYLTKVKVKRFQGIIIDDNLAFTPHIEHITEKCKIAYNRLTLYLYLSPHLALQLYKAFIRSKLESGCNVWGFRIHIDLHLEELQQHEAVKLMIKEDNYIHLNMIGRHKAHKMGSHFENIRSLTKQILQILSQTKNSHTHEDGGAKLRICFWHLLMNLKNK